MIIQSFLLSFLFSMNLSFEGEDVETHLQQSFAAYAGLTPEEKELVCKEGDTFSCVLYFLESQKEGKDENEQCVAELRQIWDGKSHNEIASYLYITRNWRTMESGTLFSEMQLLSPGYRERIYPLYLKRLYREGKKQEFMLSFKMVPDEEVALAYMHEKACEDPLTSFQFLLDLPYNFSEDFYKEADEIIRQHLGRIKPSNKQKEYAVWQMLQAYRHYNYRDCEKIYRKSFSRHSLKDIHDWRARLVRAMAYTKRREHSRALPIYAELLETKDSFSVQEADTANLYRMGGYSLSAAGKEKEAADWYMEGVKAFSTTDRAADFLYRAGEISRVSGDLAAAEDYYNALMKDFPSSVKAKQVSFLLFWVQYSQKKYNTALGSLERVLAMHPKGSYSARRAEYWKARVLERLGHKDAAYALYREVIEHAPSSYYGALAASRLKMKGEKWKIPEHGKSDMRGVTTEGVMPETLWLMAAYTNGDRTLERRLLTLFKPVILEKGKENDRVFAAFVAREAEVPDLAVEFLKSVSVIPENTKDYIKFQHSIGFEEEIVLQSDFYDVSPLFVFSVARQESMFKPDVVSPSNAIGLLQLLVPTANKLSKQEGYGKINQSILKNPVVNARFGVKFLGNLLNKYDGNMLLAAAAYNGGPGRVSRWLDRMKGLEIDEFVEEIPIFETRNYVKRVMTNYATYHYLYKDEVFDGIEFSLEKEKDTQLVREN